METYEGLGHHRRGAAPTERTVTSFFAVSTNSRRGYRSTISPMHTLIPVLDMASWMHPDKNKKIDALMNTRARVVTGNSLRVVP